MVVQARPIVRKAMSAIPIMEVMEEVKVEKPVKKASRPRKVAKKK